MQINSINNSITQSRVQNTSFSAKYPFGDVMSIMTACYAHNTESVDKTCASIVKREVGDTASRRRNFNEARNLLVTKYSNLAETAASFVKAIDSENPKHFSIPKERMEEIVDAEAKKFGSNTIDINV